MLKTIGNSGDSILIKEIGILSPELIFYFLIVMLTAFRLIRDRYKANLTKVNFF